MKHVVIYTDGACRGNPGPGGWGALLRYGQHEKILSGSETHTTNNRMELSAAIYALRSLTQPCKVDLYTDSQYVQRGVTEWLTTWKNKQWKTASKRQVKNADLWQMLDVEQSRHKVTWHWVRGHNGHPQNERADAIANAAIDTLMNKDA